MLLWSIKQSLPSEGRFDEALRRVFRPKDGWILSLGRILRRSAVSTATRDILSLLRSRANASTTTTETGTAALRLALVVLEHEQIVITRAELLSQQLLIGSSVSPHRYVITRR